MTTHPAHQTTHETTEVPTGSLSVSLHYAYMLCMLAVLAAILTAAMVFQYGYGELPCPLCLLQRLAMLGVCFGIILQFRSGFSYQNVGISLLFTVFLLIVSVRQTLLDIYPRPGHEYIGTAIFGIHMPVWSVLIATALFFGFALQFILFGNTVDQHKQPVAKFPTLKIVAAALSLYVVAIGVINFGSVGVQCGFGQCHTMGYALLK